MEHDLTDIEYAALLAGFEEILSHRGVGVCATEWGKHLGDGLFEFRVRHTEGEIRRRFAREQRAVEGRESVDEPAGGVLLRVFCHAYGAKIVLLLNGYDKGADTSRRREQREITIARKRLTEFREGLARERRAQRGRTARRSR